MLAREERALIERWRSIDVDADEEALDESDRALLLSAKTAWFSDAFDLLMRSPPSDHIWCDHAALMAPLLETFHAFPFSDSSSESPLVLLWRRLSLNLSVCTHCICQHHQSLLSYAAHYHSLSVAPLLQTLARLNEDRVARHLARLNARADYDAPEVVPLMFEVLMYPALLDDAALISEFLLFIEALDDSYQLTLSPDQQYPGVFALLFFGARKARAVGLRLAKCMGNFRLASDLEPLQPLLKRWIGFLESDALPPPGDDGNPRPRVQLKRPEVWLGIKSLLAFLDGPAFEDGILERYPVFLNIVLNHVNDDTSDFSHAVSCLKSSFEILGCKLWLRASLSPSVMRNTLLGHCFHTREEKSHKDIFDLFIPFLQSLEALQDGDHEKQRRNILYFLLHQVTRSSNFSTFTRQNACKIAILIVYRGYKMEPPSPPFECAHMWGPTLVSLLKDTTLHNSLRQPAFDLINSIIISDACALVSKRLSFSRGDNGNLYDEEDDDTSFLKYTENNNNCWSEFCSQWNMTSRECNQWRCIPLLWYTAMLQVDPMNLPISFSMAIFWVLSRASLANLSAGNNERMSQSVDEWLGSHAGEISACFQWEIPSGSNDGGDGKESKNSVEVAAASCSLLLRSLIRFAVQFVVQIQKKGLQTQWTWEPAMAESLVLLLIDPNDSIRQAGRVILEHVSQTRMLTAGLQFLCSSSFSLSSMFLGLRYALRLVQVDPISQSFYSLHHIFFVARKLLKEVVNPDQSPQVLQKGASITLKPLMEGGFIRQLGFSNHLNEPHQSMANHVDMQSWEKFCSLLSTILWPFIVKCLEKGCVIYDEKKCEMASVRLLEMLPCVVERLCVGLSLTQEDYSPTKLPNQDLAWLSHLANWGKSSLVVLTRHWRQCILSALQILRKCLSNGPMQLLALESMLNEDRVDMDKFLEKASACEASSVSKEVFSLISTRLKSPPSDAVAAERAPPNRDDSNIIQEASWSSTKLETDQILSANRAATLGLVRNTDGSTDTTTKSTLLGRKVSSKDGKLIKPSEADEPAVAVVKKPLKPSEPSITTAQKPLKLAEKPAIVTAQKPLKPAEPAVLSEKKQLKVHSKEASLLKQVVQEDQPDPLDVALDKACRGTISLPLTRSIPLPQKRSLVHLPMSNGSRNSLLGNRNSKVVTRFKRPNFEKWYKEIFKMDYFSSVGIISKNGEREELSVNLQKVPLYFSSESEYFDIFRPLVLEEFKAQLRAAYLESSVEEMECGSFCVLSVERVDEFLLVRGRPDEKEYIRNQGGCLENDLVLLTKEPIKNSEQPVHVLGKVDRREKGDKNQPTLLVIRFLMSNELARFVKVRKFLTERSKWYLNKVFNLTPQMREFQALSSLHEIPILPIILNPRNFHDTSSSGSHKAPLDRLGERMKRYLISSYNDSQLLAIGTAIGLHRDERDFELSLIQGPPGTGKTRTIVAIVSALLSSPLMQKKTSSCTSSLRSNQMRNPTSNHNLSSSSSVARSWQDLELARQLMKESKLQQHASYSGSEKYVRGGRVLVCAQSNAAVDELLSRLSNGLIGNDGEKYKPYIVRVGNQKTIHTSSLPFFIDTLVEQKVSEDMKAKADNKAGAEFESTISLRARLEKVVDDIRRYEARRAKLNSNDLEDDSSANKTSLSKSAPHDIPDDQIDAKLNQLYRHKREIITDLKNAHTNEKRLAEENRALKQKVRKQILMDAQIVLTTLSGAGGDLYSVCSEAASAGKFGNVSENTLFDVVVIDEAAQALEPATLIPLQLLKSRGTKCIMVGDPKQLPATVISDVASKFSYECSMFERLQRAGHPVIMLTQQYRMHPEICRFPSLHFYDGKLLNGAHMEDRLAPFHETNCLGPYMFFDVRDGQERLGRSSGSQSLLNESEAEAITEILRFLNKRYPSELACKKIGIITPYKSQLYLLRSKFNSSFGPEAVSDMELNTVDGFQGREVDILLLSTVRSSSYSGESGGRSGIKSIGFVADVRRMNVALTRAKFSLWVFGNSRTLQVNPNWTALIHDAKKRNLFASISKPYSSAFTTKGRFGPLDATGKDTKMSCRDYKPEQSMQMSIPVREREPMKRANENEVGISKGSKRNYADPKDNPRSTRKNENVGGGGSSVKRRSDDITRNAKEANNKSSSKNHENSNPGQGKGNDSNSMGREKRRVMPMPTLESQGSRGHKPSIYNKDGSSKGGGGAVEAGERKRGKVGEREGDSVLCSARKRSREDVDSLLSSALISSKKKS